MSEIEWKTLFRWSNMWYLKGYCTEKRWSNNRDRSLRTTVWDYSYVNGIVDNNNNNRLELFYCEIANECDEMGLENTLVRSDHWIRRRSIQSLLWKIIEKSITCKEGRTIRWIEGPTSHENILMRMKEMRKRKRWEGLTFTSLIVATLCRGAVIPFPTE